MKNTDTCRHKHKSIQSLPPQHANPDIVVQKKVQTYSSSDIQKVQKNPGDVSIASRHIVVQKIKFLICSVLFNHVYNVSDGTK